MTFSNIVKEEFLKDYFDNECCNIAFLSAITHTAGSINIKGGKIFLEIISKNAKLIERLKRDFTVKFKAVCKTDEKGSLNSLKFDSESSLLILKEAQIVEYDENKNIQLIEGIYRYLLENECCKKAYLKGAFLGSGTIAVPNDNSAGYQLEFVFSNEILAGDILKILNEFSISASIIRRKESFVLYLKNSESISDFLALMSASKSVMELQNLILTRYISNTTNRQNNCIIANAIKNFDAAINQVYAISVIEKHIKIESLTKPLRQAAELRLDNPESSIEELAKLAGISKSGMNHRLRKLNEIAEELLSI